MKKEQEIRKKIKKTVNEITPSEIRERIEKDEQEAIKRANKLLEIKSTPFNNSKSILIDKTDLKTVLNMLKEKDKEIEKYKNMIIEHKKQLRQSGVYGYDYDLKID